ncbi:MAG: cation transporter [Paludibacteraceae bacterium]|jgi:copper chaperone CopZ|nr:cation transporter [Paludibacteraceae bacterium]
MHKRVFVVIFLLVGTLFTYATSKAQFNAMVGSKAAKNRIEQVAKTIPGVKGVNVNTKQGLVEISYDEKKTSLTQISSALSAAGVYASSLGENCANKPGGCLNNAPTVTNTMR